MDGPNLLQFRTLSELVGSIAARAGFSVRSGLSFGGKRDMYSALGFARTLTVGEMRDRFKRGGIAGRIVDAFPKATWRGGIELIEDADPEVETKFETAWNEGAKRLGVWQAFAKLDIVAGFSRYAVLLVGAPGELNTPLPRMSSMDDIAYLQAFAEDEAIISTLVEDRKDPRFGFPLMYKIRRNLNTISNASFDSDVHWTRVLHIADNVLTDPVYGEPRIARVWNDLDNLDKVVGGGSEAFWLRVHQGLFFNIDPEVKVSPEQVAEMKEKAEAFANNMNRTLAMRGADVKALGSDVANFSGQVTSIISLISGASGIPQRILLGSERGELASTQDKENWDVRVSDRREDFASPCVVRPFVKMLIDAGALPKPKDFNVRWPDIEELSEDQKAKVADVLSKLNAQASGPVILPEEIRDRVLQLDPLTPEQIAEYEEAHAAPDMTQAGEEPPPEEGEPPAAGGSGQVEAGNAPGIPNAQESPRSAAARLRALKSTSNEWKAIHLVARKGEARFAGMFLDAARGARNAFDRGAFSVAVSIKDKGAAQAVVNVASSAFREELHARVPALMRELLHAAGSSTARALRKRKRAKPSRPGGYGYRMKTADLQIEFDAADPRTVLWARTYAGTMIAQIEEQTRLAVRNIMGRAFEEGLPPAESASLLEEVIGLDERRASAVENLRGRILEAEGGSLKISGRTTAVPEDVSDEWIERKQAAYAEELLHERATAIARTESLAIANGAQQEMWTQALSDGFLDDSVVRVWITTPDDRLCEECVAMNGATAEINGVFESEDEGPVEGPPLHTMCRCAQGIAMRESSEPTPLEDEITDEDEPTVARARVYHLESYLRFAGGPGSGNFGHGGRPGQVGGSTGKGSGGASNENAPLANPSFAMPSGFSLPTPRTATPQDTEETFKYHKYEQPAPGGVGTTHELSKDEFIALRQYQGNHYAEINKSLRNGFEHVNTSSEFDKAGAKSTLDTIAHLDPVFDKVAPTSQDMTIMRGIDGAYGKQLIAMGSGTVLEDPAYQSSTKKSVEDVGYDVVMRITVPKGSKVIDVNAQLGKASLVPREQEILLPRGMRFVVTGVEDHPTSQHQKILNLQMLPQARVGGKRHAVSKLGIPFPAGTPEYEAAYYQLTKAKAAHGPSVTSSTSAEGHFQIHTPKGTTVIAKPGVNPPAAGAASVVLPETPAAGIVGGEPLSVAALTQIGGQAGSNKGGLFQAADGTRYYIKQPKDLDHVQNEILAGALYKAAGVRVPELAEAKWPGGAAGVASKIEDVQKVPVNDLINVPGAAEGLVADAWLANWDVVGLSYDNLSSSNGTALRLDAGGSLEYRAQGAAKGAAFGNEVTELNTLRNPSINPQSAKVFGKVSDEELAKGAGRVTSITDAQIRSLVAEHGNHPGLADKLIARRDYIAAWAEKVSAKQESASSSPWLKNGIHSVEVEERGAIGREKLKALEKEAHASLLGAGYTKGEKTVHGETGHQTYTHSGHATATSPTTWKETRTRYEHKDGDKYAELSVKSSHFGKQYVRVVLNKKLKALAAYIPRTHEEYEEVSIRLNVSKLGIPYPAGTPEYEHAYYLLTKAKQEHGKENVSHSLSPEGHYNIHTPGGAVQVQKTPGLGKGYKSVKVEEGAATFGESAPTVDVAAADAPQVDVKNPFGEASTAGPADEESQVLTSAHETGLMMGKAALAEAPVGQDYASFAAAYKDAFEETAQVAPTKEQVETAWEEANTEEGSNVSESNPSELSNAGAAYLEKYGTDNFPPIKMFAQELQATGDVNSAAIAYAKSYMGQMVDATPEQVTTALSTDLEQFSKSLEVEFGAPADTIAEVAVGAVVSPEEEPTSSVPSGVLTTPITSEMETAVQAYAMPEDAALLAFHDTLKEGGTLVEAKQAWVKAFVELNQNSEQPDNPADKFEADMKAYEALTGIKASETMNPLGTTIGAPGPALFGDGSPAPATFPHPAEYNIGSESHAAGYTAMMQAGGPNAPGAELAFGAAYAQAYFEKMGEEATPQEMKDAFGIIKEVVEKISPDASLNPNAPLTAYTPPVEEQHGGGAAPHPLENVPNPFPANAPAKGAGFDAMKQALIEGKPLPEANSAAWKAYVQKYKDTHNGQSPVISKAKFFNELHGKMPGVDKIQAAPAKPVFQATPPAQPAPSAAGGVKEIPPPPDNLASVSPSANAAYNAMSVASAQGKSPAEVEAAYKAQYIATYKQTYSKDPSPDKITSSWNQTQNYIKAEQSKPPTPPGAYKAPGFTPAVQGTPGTTHDLNKKEYDSIRVYQGSGYHSINGNLRGGGPPDHYALAMDKVYARVAPSDQEIVVNRGIDGNFANKVKGYGVGATWEDKGYHSTSTGSGFGGSVRFKITIPAGTRYLNMNKILDGKSVHPGEQEILLNRGTKFLITKTEAPTGHHGVHTIHMTVVP